MYTDASVQVHVSAAPLFEIVPESIFFDRTSYALSVLVVNHHNVTLDSLYMHALELLGASNVSRNLPYMTLQPYSTSAPTDAVMVDTEERRTLEVVSRAVPPKSCVSFQMQLTPDSNTLMLIASNYSQETAFREVLDLWNTELVEVHSLPERTTALCPYSSTVAISYNAQTSPREKKNKWSRAVLIPLLVVLGMALAGVAVVAVVVVLKKNTKNAPDLNHFLRMEDAQL